MQLTLFRFQDTALYNAFYKAWVKDDRYLSYISGIRVTFLISIFAILVGIVIGMLVAVGKVSATRSKKASLFGWICNLYTTVIRGTPVYLQLLILYNLVFASPKFSPIFVGAICFGLNSGAYVAEIFRAGIESINKGQMEAGRSLGLNYIQTMFSIIVPQAIRNILPALGNEFITLIKETSVAGVIAVTDLTKAAQYVGSVTYEILPPLFIAAAFYLVVVMVLGKLQKMLERRLAKGDRH